MEGGDGNLQSGDGVGEAGVTSGPITSTFAGSISDSERYSLFVVDSGGEEGSVGSMEPSSCRDSQGVLDLDVDGETELERDCTVLSEQSLDEVRETVTEGICNSSINGSSDS